MMISRFLIFILLIPFMALCQEEVQVDADLLRALDGRAKTDILTDKQLTRIAQESILLKTLGVDNDILKKALELKKKERDVIFSNKPMSMIKGIITVSTDPSAKTPVIYTTPGHETLVNVIDQSGMPWPIVLASSGNNLLFKTETIEQHIYKNVFRLSSLERVGSSNVTLLLEGKSLSLTIRVENSKKKYHPQPIIQVTEFGPNGKHSPYQNTVSTISNDKIMKNLMFGLTPKGFESLRTSHAGVVAWKNKEGQLFLKTKLNPINPAPITAYSGPSGFSAYELDLWPVLVMSDDNGVEHQVNITED